MPVTAKVFRCGQCGHAHPGPTRNCRPCLDALSRKRKALIVSGLCSSTMACGNPAAPGKAHCPGCAKYFRDANRKSRRKKAQAKARAKPPDLNDYDSVL